MIQDIKYTGLSATPSDYSSPDGDLALPLNLLNDAGELRSNPQPELKFELANGQSVIFIHKGNPDRYIITDITKGITSWADEDMVSSAVFDPNKTVIQITEFEGLKITDIEAIGNILIVITDCGIRYLFWDNTKGAYKFLGDNIPQIDASFALESEFVYDHKLAKLESENFYQIEQSNEEELLKTWFFPADTLDVERIKGQASDTCSTGQIVLDGLNLENGKSYTIKVECGMDYYQWGLHTAEQPGDCQEYCHSLTSVGSGSESRTFACTNFLGYLHFYINFFVSYDHPEFSKLQHSVTVSIFKRTDEASNYVKVPKNTKENFDHIYGRVNEFISKNATEKNKFIYPFFVRYAVKMYDGTYGRISQPILLIPNSNVSPLVSIHFNKFTGSDTPDIVNVYAFISSLLVKIEKTQNLANWSDLIEGIDIFVSEQQWLYNQSMEFNSEKYPFSILWQTTHDDYTISRISTDKANGSDKFECYSIDDFVKDRVLSSDLATVLKLSGPSKSEIKDKVLNLSGFYKISSINFDEVIYHSQSFKEVSIEKGSLKNLVVRQHLEDDLIPYQYVEDCILHSYNNRLHACNPVRELLTPTHIHTCCGMQELTEDKYDVKTYVYIRTEEGDRVVVNNSTQIQIPKDFRFPYFYYPNNRAYKAIIICTNNLDSDMWFELNLKPHSLINGSFWISDSFTQCVDINTSKYSSLPEVSNKLHSTGVMWVSEVNNPFVFSNSKSITIGANKIKAISTAAKALSQGQFGQFPLYAFTDEGVWALELSSTGTYAGRQPTTRDVLRDKDSILQLDSEVLFATDRGLMLLSGSDAQCISDIIDNRLPFNPKDLPGIEKIFPDCPTIIPFKEFIDGCRMIYDYTNQRIIVFNPDRDKPYAYAFSLKSKLWSLMQSNLASTINSYPEALAVTHDGSLVNLSASTVSTTQEGDNQNKGLLITRPIKLGAPDILKTVDNVIQRGQFQKGHVASILYGSRDLIHWHPVRSSVDHILRGFSGTPYKYFRIALLANLVEGESISGASFQFTPRDTYQPR